MRFAVVRALFNAEITAALLDGALRGFADNGIARGAIDVLDVPGAFELPLAALWLAHTERYAAIVCLGCVIRGETPHFEYVADAAARGIGDVALQTEMPVIFGVLTTENAAQAWERAAPLDQPSAPHAGADGAAARSPLVRGNKGYEASLAAVHMAKLRASIQAERH